MSRINTNVPALQAVHHLRVNYDDLNVRLERLSTGLRINRGRDDPAGLIASEILRSEIRSIQQAIDNSVRANNVITTVEGAMNEVSALLVDLQGLVVSTSNETGLTEAEVRANQLEVDSILDSIDRIANTTKFGTIRLLDGSMSYLLSDVPAAAFDSVSVFAAQLPRSGVREVKVTVTQSAQRAQVQFVGATPGGISQTSATTIEIRGVRGTSLLTFGSGTNLAEIQNAINNVVTITGVSATVSAPSMAGVASALVLNSTDFGSDAFVSVEPIAGNFIVNGNNAVIARDTGVDAGVLIDGQPTTVHGFRADVRYSGLDARLYLGETFGQTLSSATFTIAGGGAVFQLTPEVRPAGQLNFGFNSIRTTQLGNAVTGRLYTLRSGSTNDFATKNFDTAQAIVDDAIEQVASYRGRLGSMQRNHIEDNINSQQVTLENVTASESNIRDADMAVEVSALTRAQILVQSTQTSLQIANSLPNLVLALLQ